jgi:hypothetical protein
MSARATPARAIAASAAAAICASAGCDPALEVGAAHGLFDGDVAGLEAEGRLGQVR